MTMIAVISPAKKLVHAPTIEGVQTVPHFLEDANQLASVAKNLSIKELEKLMSLSTSLASLNHERFQKFQHTPDESTLDQALYTFAGDTYVGLDAKTLDENTVNYAQSHLRILSGLYGLLRPRDGIQPYRLEMGCGLKNPKGRNLYAYWGGQISNALNELASELGATYLLNCASQEYFGAVKVDQLQCKIINPIFREEKDGNSKIISFYAKKARGAMARYMLEAQIDRPEGIKDFSAGGYRFQAALSSGQEFVFTRPYAGPKS